MPQLRRLLPFLFLSSLLAACGDAAFAPISDLTLDEAAEIVAEEAGGAGIVLAVRVGERPQHITTAGFSDIGEGTPIQPNDSFRIGSMTKTFVGILLVGLEEDGLLHLDDPAADYLDASTINAIENAHEASIRELLNMTSGIYDYLENDAFWDAHADNPTFLWRPLDVLAYAQGQPAEFAPGDGWSYSNTNYILLQLIAEEATGKPLGQLMEERILVPANMTDSYLEHYRTGPLVNSYEYGEDITGFNDGTGMGDGGLISTVADLDKFLRAVYNGDIVGEAALDAFFEPAGAFGNAAEYGLGVELDDEFGAAWGHTGATAGFSGEFWYLEETNATIIILRNAIDDVDTTEATDAAFALARE